MAVHVGLRGPAHLSRSGGFYPDASLALDFLAGRYRVGAGSGSTESFSGLPNLTVTRASTGYAERVDGTLVSFASGVARITDKGLLVEESRTNLALRSQEFDNNSVWQNVFSSATANATTAPDGTLTADKLSEDSTAGQQHRLDQNVSFAAATAYTLSVYMKPAGRTWVQLRIAASGAYFNLTGAGSVGTIDASVTAGIRAVANGWYWLYVTFTPGGASAARIGLATGDTVNNYAGDGTSGAYIWGGQVEAGSFPTSYIPTTTASATRAADVPLLGSVALSYPVTVYAEWQSTTDHVAIRTMIGGASGGPSLKLNSSPAVTAAIRAVATLATSGNFYTEGAIGKAASRMQSGSNAVALNGGTVVTSATAFSPTTPGTIGLGVDGLGSNELLNGYLRRALIYPRAFSDAELQAATA